MTETRIMIRETPEDLYMRKCIIRFLERISYDEDYIKIVKEVKDNKTKIEIFNQFKIIRRNKIINGKKR